MAKRCPCPCPKGHRKGRKTSVFRLTRTKKCPNGQKLSGGCMKKRGRKRKHR